MARKKIKCTATSARNPLGTQDRSAAGAKRSRTWRNRTALSATATYKRNKDINELSQELCHEFNRIDDNSSKTVASSHNGPAPTKHCEVSSTHMEQTQAPFTRLPKEILDQIVHCFSATEAYGRVTSPQTQDLHKFSMICKRLHHAVESVLYSAFVLSKETIPPYYVWNAEDPLTLPYFLQTLLRNPKLRQHTKIVDLGSSRGDGRICRTASGRRQLAAPECPRLRQIDFGLSLQGGNEEAQIVLLLTLLYNLKTLRIMVPTYDNSAGYWIRELFRRSSQLGQPLVSSIQPFAHLKHLALVGTYRHSSTTTLLQLLELLRVPSLATLSVTGYLMITSEPASATVLGEDLNEKLPGKSPIKHVLLDNCEFNDPGCFTQFAKLFQSLTSLVIMYGDDYSCGQPDWPKIVVGLDRHSKTLTSLKLSAVPRDPWYTPSALPQSLPTLSRFGSLRTLYIQQSILTGYPSPLLGLFQPVLRTRQLVDILPQRIEDLTISECTPFYLHSLLEVLLDDVQYCARFKKLAKLTTILMPKRYLEEEFPKLRLGDPGELDDLTGVRTCITSPVRSITLTEEELGDLTGASNWVTGPPRRTAEDDIDWPVDLRNGWPTTLAPDAPGGIDSSWLPSTDPDPYHPDNLMQTLFDALPELHDRLTKGFVQAGITWTHDYRDGASYGLIHDL